MSRRLIKHRERVSVVTRDLWFPVHSPGHGFGFACDEHGKVDAAGLNPAARENYEMCTREHAGIAEIRTNESFDIEPGIIKCDCGKHLEVWDHHDVDCPRCHREYNSAGQLLASRSQWGEETGETAGDYDRGAAGDHGMDEL